MEDIYKDSEATLREATSSEYKYGFTSDIDTDIVPPGLSEDVIRFISAKKHEPEWLLDFRLKAYRHWLTLRQPEWAHLKIPPIDFQAISYYAAPKPKEEKKSLDEVDPELLDTFNKLGISLEEQKRISGVAVDAVLDVCRAAYPKEQSLSLFIPDAPLLQMPVDSAATTRTITSYRYPDFSVKVKVNPNLIGFYDTYPSSFINGEFTSRWVMYANTPMDADIRNQVYPSLKRQLEGMTEWEKVSHLLDLVQTGLEYEYDDNVWGCDRTFFAEESLYYPFCDCEDRAILFTRLVRDLVGLDCVLVYYPGHLASAVHFTEQPGGTFYTHANKNYTICDPTYIHASVGMEMPEWDKADVTLIPLQ